MSSWYAWVKALHVASALVFVGSVLGSSRILALAADGGMVGMPGLVAKLRRWESAVTTPAMILVWSFGVVLASDGHWFTAPWLQIKLVFVVIVSGIHGVQSGRMRSMVGTVPAPTPASAPIIVACAIAIGVLATAKP